MGWGGEAQSQLVYRASDGKTGEMGWHVWKCREAQQGRHDEISLSFTMHSARSRDWGLVLQTQAAASVLLGCRDGLLSCFLPSVC